MIKRVMKRIFLIVFSILLITSTSMQFTAAIGKLSLCSIPYEVEANGSTGGGLTISCFGDSVTHSYPYGDNDPLQAIEKTYPSVLQSKLDNQFGEGYFTVVNHGINGFKAEDLRTNLQTQWLNENPTVALVMIGGNDLSAASTVREFMLIAQETVGEVQDCVDIIKAHVNPDGQRPEVIVSAFIPNRLGVPANWGIKYYNSLLENQLTNIDLFFSNNFEDLYDSTARQAKSGLMYDLVHPNDAGYEVIAENWYKVVAYVPGEVIVGLKDADDRPLITRLIKDKGGKVIRQLNDLDAVVAKVNEKRVKAFMKGMRESSLVRYVERNGKVMLDLTPNDPGWSNQWGPKKIQADTAWNTQTGDKSILVAVVDTGVDWNHPDLAANYVSLGYDWWNYDSDPMDDHGHGTHCAGIIAAVLNNGKGMAGLAQVRVMAEKFLSSGGWGTYYDAGLALRHAADAGADIISNSWGGYGDSEWVHEAVRYAYNKGALLVAAAGNDGSNSKLYPAAYEEVVAVTATDQSDNPAWFTNYGSWVEVAAPGVSIYSTVWDDSYASWSGTSMATPHVAGVAALIWSQFPGMTRDQVRARLRDKADDLGASGFDIYYGYGRINAREAVGTSPPPSAPSDLTATAVSSSQINLAWKDNSADESDFHIERKSGGTWSEIQTVGANTVSYQDTGLRPSTTYYYRVRAHRHSDNLYSGYSNEASATTQTLYAGPRALSFDGEDDYVIVSHNSVLNFAQSFTVESWIKPNTITGEYRIVEKRSGHTAVWALEVLNSKASFNFKVDGVWQKDVKSSTTLSTGNWYHVLATYDGAQKKIYLNGELSGSNIQTGNMDASSDPLMIGIHISSGINQFQFNGVIDEVRVYNRALNSDEIAYSYQNEAPQDKTGLVMWLRMNEGSGSTAYDETANDNDGTIHGPTWVEDHGKSQETPPSPSGSYALSFDGEDDYVEVTQSSGINDLTAFTYEAWVYVNAYHSSYASFISCKGLLGKQFYVLRSGLGGRLEGYVGTSGRYALSRSSEAVGTGAWHHVVMTFDDGGDRKIRLYMDGSEVSYDIQIAATGTMNSESSEGLEIGGIAALAGRTINGIIDEVRVYNRALSSQEITYSYQNEAPQHQTGLVMWLRMNEGSGSTAYDENAYNNDGTIHGPTWVEDHGKSQETPPPPSGSYALSFDGEDDYVDCGSSTSLDDLSVFTWEAFVRIDEYDPSYSEYIFMKGWAAGKQFFVIRSGEIEGWIGASTTDAHSRSSGTISKGVWHHVAMVYDDNNDRKIHLFLDGQEVSYAFQTAAVGTLDSEATENLEVGGTAHHRGRTVDGAIDEVRVYNRALSSDEIAYSYENEAPQHQTGLVMWLRMNEGSGSTAYDETNNDNDGTIHGPTWVSTT